MYSFIYYAWDLKREKHKRVCGACWSLILMRKVQLPCFIHSILIKVIISLALSVKHSGRINHV